MLEIKSLCQIPLCFTSCCTILFWLVLLLLNFHPSKSSLHAIKTEAEEFKQMLNGNTSILSSTAKDAVQPQSVSVVEEPDPKQLTLVETKRE
ncbi:hypothetical protein TIFTF001_007742 [Ficus carica]|uniref:Uncharacterized protein n=1 Tax=Ficus carica TaxID=3494 RepID=A0AA88D155_FICCA|nr:hypothetical protein TIFTF001_007742 [Ficus carica]